MPLNSVQIFGEFILHVEPSITLEQYRAALEAIRKPSDKRFGRSQWLRVAVIITLSFSIFIAVKTPDTQRSSLVVLISLATLYLALSLLTRFKTKSCLKQAYTAQEKQLQGQRMDVTESGIIGQWADGNASYQYKWTAFERFIELPDAFLFLPNSVSFVRIPKTSLSVEEQQDIKRWSGASHCLVVRNDIGGVG
jgi:hypothetical protein